ncbi:PIN domain nuclease [Pelagicoccus sp. SDUM812003]|uniref:type II toxin-antitoxin system VapC family toxin n=1 Tax=Pelagicoccus sp. SDUM812003 TaxID=3041267 RepID=UPI00280ECD20|nr:PIN domain nuclease [Pelagicoccus sp. SDUM812003]MDQ8205719.1 PIN domain nuclease [Pelagicoccus sp. SDUM812003]
MTIVDTSVWIDFLEGGEHWTKERLKEKLGDRESLLYTEMILLEIIQGIRSREGRERIEKEFSTLVLASQKRSTTLLAAEIYQELQRKGFRIRSIIDCLIAATAIETGATVLHKDRDFEVIASHYPVITEKK